MTPAGYYTEHFSAREMCASESAARKGIDNTPPLEARANLARLCETVLEPLRARLGALRVTSGYRSPVLNGAIGGSRTSAHMKGLAADLEPLVQGVTLREMAEYANTSGLPIDQVIYEYGTWVHVGIAEPGRAPRHQALMIFPGTGYVPFNSSDDRVK